MARARIADRDPRGRVEASAQHLLRLAEKGVLAFDQQPHQLALVDGDAEVLQQGKQARHGGLALMVLGEHEALQLGPKVRGDPGRQRRHDGPAVRRLPALAPIKRGQRLDDQVLDQELLVALEPSVIRHVLGRDPVRLVDRQLGPLDAAPADFALAPSA